MARPTEYTEELRAKAATYLEQCVDGYEGENSVRKVRLPCHYIGDEIVGRHV